jgi:heme exporter protein D
VWLAAAILVLALAAIVMETVTLARRKQTPRQR